jgi:predicted GNAT superfamily acetyltransferase
MNNDITIRRAETVADYRACQDAQRRAWGIAEDNYVVPIATMVGAQHHGGLVLGAFLPGGEAVGVSFAFLGRTDGRLCLYSQLTGVVPGYQDQGIGYLLKTTQREVAWDEGVPYIAWAFDPLQAGNARFNLVKLGATAGRYVENMYGPRSDALNRNTPTDRLIAVWETAPGTRPGVATAGDLPRVITVTTGSSGAPSPAFGGLPRGAPRLLLEIPADVNRLRSEAPDLAERWGSAVRQAFEAAFAAGYRANGFLREETPEGRRGSYLLERPSPTGSSTHRA